MKILIGKDTCTPVFIVALFVIAKTRQQQDVEQPKYPSTDEWINKMWCIHNGILWHVLAHLCPTLCDSMDYSPPGSSVHGIFQVRNTGVGCHSLLQGLFLTQGSNPSLSFFESASLASPALAGGFFTTCPTWEVNRILP